jgi:NAD(P)-dependent dehydrogenase (short-subunit alcohol dehydrogenase family)
VLGGARDPSARRAPPGVELRRLDVTDPAGIAEFAAGLGTMAVDLLINNAGIYGPRGLGLGRLDYAAWREVLEVNLFGPLRVTEALLPALRRGARRQIVTVSSRMGSIGANTSGGAHLYRSSKAAVNAAMRSAAIDLAGDGFTVVLVHPGWVRTDMGGAEATIDVATSVRGLVRLITGLKPEDNGRFYDHDGTPLPW